MRDRSLESRPSAGDVAGAAASPTRGLAARDDLVHPVVRRLGPHRRTRIDLHRSLQVERGADRVDGGGAGAAGLTGAPPDGHADGSIRRTSGLHGAPRVLLACRVHRSSDRQLRLAPRGGLLARHGRVVLRRRGGIRIPLDTGGAAGHGPRRLRPGDDGAIAGRLRRPAGGRSPRLGNSLPGHQRATPWLGGRLLRDGAGIPRRPAVRPRLPR